jgi:serine/threonine protein kinase/Flp pilus assembly protein TadD
MTHTTMSPSAAPDDPRVVRALEDYAAALQRGERPDRAAFLAGLPEEVAAPLAGCLEGLELVHAVAPELSRSDGPTVIPDDLPLNQPLGDYRLIREIGRGGMGVVYEAEQLSLNRRVALKVLPFAATMDPRQLQRFRHEAQAAAMLHHPNIVPVHGVGCERSVHFYAMQLIEGQSLAAMIDELRGDLPASPERERPEGTIDHSPVVPAPSSRTKPIAAVSTQKSRRDRGHYRRIAELVAQAADALEYAHSMGVVHRDIKPANLMLDAAGHLWVTDFGLAKLDSAANLTVSGDLLGTLRYMSPEQALARHGLVDHRTDVYSLGATLYELLTFTPAVDGADKQEVLKRIAFEEPQPPRKLDRAIPAELEIIALKCLAKNPNERYVTAGDLAADLHHWLDDKPIRARRPSLVQRARRWGRRHQTLTWATAVAVLLLGIGGGYFARDRAAQRTEKGYRLEMMDRAAAEALEESDRWKNAGRRSEELAAVKRAEAVLVSGQADAKRLQPVQERRTDLEMLTKLDDILLSKSTGRRDIEQQKRAADAYAKAFRDYGIDVETLSVEVASGRIRDKAICVELAAALDDWAITRRVSAGDDMDAAATRRLFAVSQSSDPDEWRSRLRDAIERIDRTGLKEIAATATVEKLLPSTVIMLGYALNSNNEVTSSVAALGKAQRIHPGDFWINHDLGWSLGAMTPPRLDESLRYYTAALALRPQNPIVHIDLAMLLLRMGALDEARAAAHEALRLKLDDLYIYAEFCRRLEQQGVPDEALYQEAFRLRPENRYALDVLITSLKKRGLTAEIDATYATAIAARQEVVRQNPLDATAHFNLGSLLSARGAKEEAITAYLEALRLQPDRVVSADLRTLLENKGLNADIDAAFDAALAARREAVRQHPRDANIYNSLGFLLSFKDGADDEALAAFREAVRLNPNSAVARSNLRYMFTKKGDHDEAILVAREAVVLRPDDFNAHMNLGVAYGKNGQKNEALAAFREAVRLRPDSYMAHYDMGTSLSKIELLAEAEAALRRAIYLQPDFGPAHCNLASVLQKQDRFEESLAEYRRGIIDLRIKRRDWLRTAERLVALQDQLPTLLSGEVEPTEAVDYIALAELCHRKRRYAASARFFAGAFNVDPVFADGDQGANPAFADGEQGANRDWAALSALMAAAGEGTDAAQLGETERAQMRRQALDWLTAYLAAQINRPETRTDLSRLRQTLNRWQKDREYAIVRDEAALVRLPEVEQEAWRRFWAEVAAAPARSQASRAPAEKSDKKPQLSDRD